jgi:hypothetical protein
MNPTLHSSLSGTSDVGPFWQNQCFAEQQLLDFETIDRMASDDCHPLYD